MEWDLFEYIALVVWLAAVILALVRNREKTGRLDHCKPSGMGALLTLALVFESLVFAVIGFVAGFIVTVLAFAFMVWTGLDIPGTVSAVGVYIAVFSCIFAGGHLGAGHALRWIDRRTHRPSLKQAP